MVKPLAPAAPGAAKNLMTAELFKKATSRSRVRMVSASNLMLRQHRQHLYVKCGTLSHDVTG